MFLAVELEILERFVDPLMGHFYLDRRFVLAELQIVLDTRQGHLTCQELAELLLRLDHVVRPYPCEHPGVKLIVGPRKDHRHTQILENEGNEHAVLDALADHYRRSIELLDPEVA